MRRQNGAHRIDRRSFLRGIAAGATAAPLASFAVAESDRSRVVVAERADVIVKGRVDRKLVKETVDALVKKLSGKANVDEAWRTFVSPKETVALKFNGLFRNASTRPEVIWAVCRGLTDAGVSQEKIILFDRDRKDFDGAGLEPFEDLPKIQFLAADSEWGAELKAGSVTTRITRILTNQADAIINLPCMKDHVIAGVTLSMKNHLGSVPNARDFHREIDTIADLNLLPPIRKKTRLALCDAIVGIFEGGPQYRGPDATWQAKSLLAATDVVALDAVGAEMIHKIQKSKGVDRRRRPQRRGRDRRGKPSSDEVTHIAHAAEIGLGTADLEKIEIVKV